MTRCRGKLVVTSMQCVRRCFSEGSAVGSCKPPQFSEPMIERDLGYARREWAASKQCDSGLVQSHRRKVMGRTHSDCLVKNAPERAKRDVERGAHIGHMDWPIGMSLDPALGFTHQRSARR